MHELGLAMDIYRTCRDAVAGQGPGRLEWVKVAIGELAAVEPDLLVFAWQAVVQDGPDAGARLEVEWRPARQYCPACGGFLERPRGAWLHLCPSCERVLAVEGGDELDVLSVGFLAGAEGGEHGRDG